MSDDALGKKLLIVGMLLAAMVLAVRILQRNLSLPRNAPGAPATAAIPHKPAPPAIRGKPAPEFALLNLDGKTIRRADFNGKVVLVNFWATWCHPCLIEIPWFVEFQKQYGPKGFEVVGISLDEEKPAVIKKFVQEQKMSYTIVMGDEKTADAFGGIMGLPTSFVVDRDGKFYSMHRGLVSKQSVEEELRELLGTPPGQQAGSPAASPSPKG